MLYYLCELAKGQDAVKAYLPDKDASVGKTVRLDVNGKGKMVKGYKVTAIMQTIDPQFVEDNHMAYRAMILGGAGRRAS